MRILVIAIVLGVMISAAAADVVILKHNDIPLTGVILADHEDCIDFQIKGLGQASRITIEKTHIKRYWRDDSSHWEFAVSEREHEEAVKRVVERQEERKHPRVVVSYESPPPPPRGRSDGEVRNALLDQTLNRLKALLPEGHLMDALLIFVSLAGFGGLTFLGAKVADLPALTFKRSMILSLLAGSMMLLMVLVLPRYSSPPALLPVLIVALVVLWLLAARFLGHGHYSKSILLLSFVLSSIFVIGSSVFGVFAVL
jgi:hypothetical protein